MFQIRRIKPEDIGFVMQLTTENGIDRGKLLANIENFLICEDNNIKCGCGCLVTYVSKGFLNWVAVSEGHRGNGFGSAITKALLNIAEHKGVEEVYAPGICTDFLKVLGFEESSCKPDVDRAMEVLGDTGTYLFYKVSLKDYFKTCSQK